MKPSQKEKLWNLCSKFIKDLEISCGETVYQCDRVGENSLELIEKICDIVGYHKYDE